MNRLPITKTPKVYVGGAFIRSESARTFPLKDAPAAHALMESSAHIGKIVLTV